MTSDRFSLRAAVYLIMQKDNKVLLLRRFNTGWRDGMYTLPAGHVDGNETIAETMAREALEETGISISPERLNVVHTVHHMGDNEYIDFYLLANGEWNGIPSITEPDKCDDMQWFPLDQLPDNLLLNVESALNYYRKGESFSEFTWTEDKNH